MPNVASCFFPDSESRSDLFQRTRKLGLWGEAEQFINERRKVHRTAGMNRKEAGVAAWADAVTEFPVPQRENLVRLLELSNIPPVVSVGHTSEVYLWHWIVTVELLVRITSLISLPEIEQALIETMKRRVALQPAEPPGWPAKVEQFRGRSEELLRDSAPRVVPLVIENFENVERHLVSSDYDDAVRDEFQMLLRFFLQVAELQVESDDSLARALKSSPPESTLSLACVRA